MLLIKRIGDLESILLNDKTRAVCLERQGWLCALGCGYRPQRCQHQWSAPFLQNKSGCFQCGRTTVSIGSRVSSTEALVTSGSRAVVNLAAGGDVATGAAFPGPSCPLSEAAGPLVWLLESLPAVFLHCWRKHCGSRWGVGGRKAE